MILSPLFAILTFGLIPIGSVALSLWSLVWTGQDDSLFLPSNIDAQFVQTSALADPPRLPGPPGEAVSEGGGWLSRWLSVGGEGELNVILSKNHNLTFPHRPAAFPNQLFSPMILPISGSLLPFSSFLNTSNPTDQTTISIHTLQQEEGSSEGQEWLTAHNPEFGCIPPSLPPRYEPPPRPWKIALVERGECDFASKVRAAQERGAAGVIVGDGKLRPGETDEEGRKRETLITMFSPEDTEAIFIPSVFVSRATYLTLRDLLANGTESRGYTGLWIELSEGVDDGATLSSLLSFALLMPSIFLLTTIAIHRIRAARQREADRAPPLLVLSLPERIWSPDIVWEKDSDSETSPSAPSSPLSRPVTHTSDPSPVTASSTVPPPPPITPAEVETPPPLGPDQGPSGSNLNSLTYKKKRSKSGMSGTKKYFSKDECAICMDSFQRGDVVRILPCGHVFHKDECDEWLMKWRKLCPTCRADVTIPPGEVVQGTTITPVSHPAGEGVAQTESSVRSSLFNRIRLSWGRLTGRTRVQLDDETADERTPLVINPSESRSGEV